MAKTEYIPRRFNWLSGAIGGLAGVLFVVAGVAVFHAAPWHPFSVAFGILGMLGLAASVGSLFSRTLISGEGIQKRPWICGGFAARWDDIDCWSVIDNGFDEPEVRLKLRSRKRLVRVYRHEINDPGFDRFIKELRERPGLKEASRPLWH